MADQPVIYREEAVAMLFAINDINENLRKLIRIIEGDDGEEPPTEDAT
ncbi:MAG TPA: hypothetical protein VF101_18470 [Gaiellaceae bacterium]